jgi:hypothetical protein
VAATFCGRWRRTCKARRCNPDLATRLNNLDILLDPQLLQAALRVPSADDQQWFNDLCLAPGSTCDSKAAGSIQRDFT